MINFYGDFRLVRVEKEMRTSKSNDLMIFFTAATKRTKDESDFKFFKIIGKNAERFISNLEKDNDGNYKSRYMLIDGYVETYDDVEKKAFKVNMKAKDLPSEYGRLTEDFSFTIRKKIKVNKETYVVSHFTFLDSKKSKKAYIADDEDDEISYDGVAYEEDEDEELEVAATKSKSIKAINKNDSIDIYKNSKSIEKELDDFKNNKRFNYDNVNEMW